MISMIHSVLGTDYEVLLGSREEIGLDKEHMGECRIYSKKILVCTEEEDCTKEELSKKVQEIVAHEFLHAYLNEAGVDIAYGDEEKMCDFYMKNWRKMSNSIIDVLDRSGFLTSE